MRSKSVLGLALVVPLAMLAGACNTVTTGDHGVLTFTPDECGDENGCSLNDDLAVGGTMKISLDDASDQHGSDLSDLTLISSDPNVFQVALIERGAFTSEWRVTGTGGGWAELIAIDRGGFEVDHTDLTVAFSDRLDIEHHAGNAVGPTTRIGYDQVWTVNANQDVKLQAVPVRNGSRLTGKVGYRVDIDEVLFDSRLSSANIEIGQLDFRVPMGEYDVTFTSPDGSVLRVLIVAQ